MSLATPENSYWYLLICETMYALIYFDKIQPGWVMQDELFNQVVNENLVIVMLKSAVGGRAGGRADLRACGRQLLVSGQ